MRFFLLSLFALLMLFTAGSSQPTPPGNGGSNAATWKKIDQLLAKDQTTSAAKLLEPLYQQARQKQEVPEYLRTLLYKLRLLESKEEEADVQAIALVTADLKTARFPARPILHSLLAQLYANYYAQHRYQLHDPRRCQRCRPAHLGCRSSRQHHYQPLPRLPHQRAPTSATAETHGAGLRHPRR